MIGRQALTIVTTALLPRQCADFITNRPRPRRGMRRAAVACLPAAYAPPPDQLLPLCLSARPRPPDESYGTGRRSPCSLVSRLFCVLSLMLSLIADRTRLETACHMDNCEPRTDTPLVGILATFLHLITPDLFCIHSVFTQC